MKTLNSAHMIKKEMINYYIGMYAELEQKLESQRIETERVNKLLKSYSCSSYVIHRIYPIAEGLKTFEEKTSEEKKSEEKTSAEKNSETKEDIEVKNSGKSSEEEKEQVFRKQTNKEFLAKKQEEMKKNVA
ncbi:hypothetical protein HanPI659440_Chr09g0323261 [Helianthus annuus]|nr:hypothetical protein HanPI659440_Chr09g0323261 [Helianthus annuus]